jgi:phosphoribosylanthranilate isomerase
LRPVGRREAEIVWIKICGMTSGEAVRSALEAGVDAIGFVFAPSPRRVEPAQAAQLALPARGRVRCVAVTLHPQQQQLDAILRLFEPDVLQTDLEDFARLRLPDGLARLPVVRAAGPPGALLPQRLLFEGPRSGSGTMSDWHEAAMLAPRCELVLAGGLDAHNVGAAIAAVRPFGVDVSSGVEDAPGLKRPEKINQFVRAARAAFSEIEHESVHDSRGS